MRTQVDPREKEMMEKCDNEDKKEQMKHEKFMDELKEVKAFEKIKAFTRPKVAMYVGVIFLAISMEKEIVGGLGFGFLIGLLGAPLNNEYMQKAFPNTGKTEAADILKYMMEYWILIMVIANVIYLVFQFLGKKFFGMLSYNLTFGLRKLLYMKVLTKNIGFFDYAENATPVLSGVL